MNCSGQMQAIDESKLDRCDGQPIGFSTGFLQDLHTSLTADTTYHTDQYVDTWVMNRLQRPTVKVTLQSLTKLHRWLIDPDTGNIQHDTDQFFSITGVTVRHRTPAKVLCWDQPIIEQPEIGILGILTKRINGILHFCLQAKEEPGNINSMQLSPTVQATYSNYTKAHGGTSPLFLEQFLAATREQILFAKLQSEDGGRFLFKSNRNMIVLVGNEEFSKLPHGYIWLSLRQIARLLKTNNLIHACTRSVISALITSAGAEANCSIDPSALAEIVQWLDDQKANNHILVKRTGLKTLNEWHLDHQGYFSHDERRFFRIIGIKVSSTSREISSWAQPILVNPRQGIIGLLTRKIHGDRQYLMQAKAEVGNRSLVQLGPTVQFTPGNYIGNSRLTKPFLFDEFSFPTRYAVLHESSQSEEGARFFRENHLHRILEMPADVELELPEDFRWVSETHLRFFLHLGEQVNSCARSVIACLHGLDDV